MGVSLIEGTERCRQWLRATRNAFSFPLDRDSPELRYRVRPRASLTNMTGNGEIDRSFNF
jgi:hypothetical protein